MPRLLITLLACLCLPALANPYLGRGGAELRRALADVPEIMQETWYQVEILVFARDSTLTEEYWRLNQQPDLNRSALIIPGDTPVLPEHADPGTVQAANLGAWQLLTEEPALTALAGKLRLRDERVLLHEQWQQPLRARNQALSVLLEGGDLLPQQADTGAETMSDAETMSEAAPLPGSVLTDSTTSAIDDQGTIVELPPLDVETELPLRRELQGALRLSLSRYLHAEPLIWFASAHPEHGHVWVKIDQKRRMRSDEVHYLDHPLFGVVLRLTPWQHPEQQRMQQIEEAIEATQIRQ